MAARRRCCSSRTGRTGSPARRRSTPPRTWPRRYHDFPLIPNGKGLQALAREEVGGTPATNPVGYALRSPIAWGAQDRVSWKPLQIWWSTGDRIVVDQAAHSAALYDRIKHLNRRRP